MKCVISRVITKIPKRVVILTFDTFPILSQNQLPLINFCVLFRMSDSFSFLASLFLFRVLPFVTIPDNFSEFYREISMVGKTSISRHS